MPKPLFTCFTRRIGNDGSKSRSLGISLLINERRIAKSRRCHVIYGEFKSKMRDFQLTFHSASDQRGLDHKNYDTSGEIFMLF